MAKRTREFITLHKFRSDGEWEQVGEYQWSPVEKTEVEPIPLVEVCAGEIMESIRKMPWEVMEHEDDISFYDVYNWLDDNRKIKSKKWRFRKRKPYRLWLGWRWAPGGRGGHSRTHWLEYNVKKYED